MVGPFNGDNDANVKRLVPITCYSRNQDNLLWESKVQFIS